MRKLYCLLVALFTCLCASSQVVNIPDSNFKAALLQADSNNEIAKNLSGNFFKIDANNDLEIQMSEATQVSYLFLNDSLITSLEGISSFTNLETLYVWNASVPSLNLTGLTNLTNLNLSNNAFTTLNLNGFGLTNLTSLNITNNPSLTILNANGLSLNECNLFNVENVNELHVSGNQLTALNLNFFPNLTTLECANNLIATFDFNRLTTLQYLNCAGNQLQMLNVNNMPNLQSLNCSNNQLTTLLISNGANEASLNLSGNPDLAFVCADAAQLATVQSLVTSYGYTDCVVDSDCSPSGLDFVVIPDAAFNARLLEADASNEIAKNLNGDFFKIDANNDSLIQLNEAMQVSYLNVSTYVTSNTQYIQSIEGILSFTNLEYIDTSGTGSNIFTLDLHGLSSMKSVNCNANGVTNVNLTGLTNLEVLSLNLSNYSTLDVSSFPNLKILSCGGNGALQVLDVSGLSNLEELDCSSDGNLQQVIFSGNTNLTRFRCVYNYSMTSFDFNSIPNVTYLDCYGIGLTTLNVNSLTNLQSLNCSSNQLQSLNVNSLANLETLNCSYNQLTSVQIKNGVTESNLDFSGNPSLEYVCSDTAQISAVQALVTSYGYTNCVVDAACSSSPSDFITIPDANFKAKLLAADSTNLTAKDLNGLYFKIDVNNDGEIQETEALQVSYLDVKISNIASLEGIASFTNLLELNCRTNQLTELHIGDLTNLQDLRCSDNQIAALDLNGLNNLLELHCSGNQLTALNTDGVPDLEELHADNNLLTTLNVSNLHNLMELHCSGNQLVSLFIKNGMAEELEIDNNPGLEYICADEFQLSDVQTAINVNGYANCTVNTYCSFTPGGIFYTIQGNNRIDSNGNGCDAADAAFPNAKFTITNGTTTNTVIATATGSYSFSVEEGVHTITPVFENPSYYNVSPSSVTVTFPTQSSPFIQNFCFTPNGVHPDLEVTVVPITEAVPGFDADFRIIYKNKGNTTQSGTVNLTFDDAVLDFVSSNPLVSSQTTATLSWNFINLQPFETRVLDFVLNVNSPMETPPVNNGDVLTYTAAITSEVTDDTPNDNTFVLNQTVVNSFDPNDKTCLEGTTMSANEIGEYVHYMIRFENSGTANARNIVVKDIIDTDKFDVNSMVPTKASHDYYVNSKGSKVEFIFENINLPFDDANNDGYVVFKIKTKPTLVVGDTFSNSASIYFDYNFPIETNTAVTTIQALSNQDFSFGTYFIVYPNPVKDVLNIETKQAIEVSSISIYNQLGQLVLVVPSAQDVSKVDVSNLASGNYFIKIYSDRGTSNAKFIKM